MLICSHITSVLFFSFSTAFQSELIPQLARPCTVAAALGRFPRSVRTQWREAHHMTACSAHRSNHMEEMITGQKIVAQGQRKQSFCTGLSQSCPLSLSLSLVAGPLACPLIFSLILVFGCVRSLFCMWIFFLWQKYEGEWFSDLTKTKQCHVNDNQL